MGGVVSGSSIVETTDKLSLDINTITLTINNQCNANCEHCYLKYNSNKNYISEEIIKEVFNSSAERIVIVGKEPFYDKKSIDILKKLLEKGKEYNKKISVITNGINLDLMDLDYLKLFDNIDISIHDGNGLYRTEEQFEKIKANLNLLEKNNFSNVNILSVIDDKTINTYNSVIDLVGNLSCLKRIMFSLFLETKRGLAYNVNTVNLFDFFKLLSVNKKFLDCNKAFFQLDYYHLFAENLEMPYVENLIETFGLKQKILFVKTPPTLMGIIRVTYDGLVMTSYDALHSENYRKYSSKLEEISSLDSYYSDLVSKFTPFTSQIVAI